jgi:MHS family proline/betaine transporter-like MFS transporter
MLQRGTRRAIGAGMIGNVLEWYDFAIYGFFAVEIGRQFFPNESPIAQLLATFGIFAIGYLMRPVGGVLIGHVCDNFGRRAALIASITAMAVPTFLIGILPGYAAIGVLAPIGLTLLRMMQGLSLGGEYPSSMVFLVERAPKGRRGVMGGLASIGAVTGLLLGSSVGAALAAIMPAEALADWGWRLPFIAGLGIGLIGSLLRRHIAETIPARRTEHAPIVETLREHWRLVARIAGVASFNAVPFYLLFVFLVSSMQIVDGFDAATALKINSLSMGTLIPCHLLGAWLADRYGRKPVMLTAAALGFITALPMFWLMNQPVPALVLSGQIGAAAFIGLFSAVMPALFVEAAPAHVRCTVVALGYNLCLGLLGGLTPFAATLLVERTGNDLSPAFLIMGAAVVAFAAVLTFKETYQVPFEGSGVAESRPRGVRQRSPRIRNAQVGAQPSQAMMSGRS